MVSNRKNSFKKWFPFLVLVVSAILLIGMAILFQRTPAEKAPVALPKMMGSEAPEKARWRLVLDESFQTPIEHTNIWNPQLRWGTTNSPELEKYSPDALSIQDGVLRIQAERNPGGKFPFTSGIIASYDHFYLQYGFVEIRAKVPHGQGLWPALWMLALDRQSAAEIDIMEMLGHETNRVYTTVHYGKTKGARGLEQANTDGPDYSQAFHTYAVDWNSDRIIWYVDGKEVYRTTQHIPHEPMYLIANLAVGGAWPGKPDARTSFPANFDIAYIRVWQKGDPTGDTIKNSSFDDPKAAPWYSPWVFRNDLGAVFNQDTTTSAAGSRAALNISLNGSNSLQPWVVAVSQFNQPLKAGQAYTLSFWAKASEKRPIRAVIQEQNAPYTLYDSQIANLSTGWEWFSFSFIATNNTSSAMLNFNLAEAAGDIWLDQVSLCPAGVNCAAPIRYP